MTRKQLYVAFCVSSLDSFVYFLIRSHKGRDVVEDDPRVR